MNEWAISNTLNEIYKLQQALAGLRQELENEIKVQKEIRETLERERK